MELSTPRLLLREFRAIDHAAVHAFASDTEVTRYTDWGPNSPLATTTFLTEVTRDVSSNPRYRFALAVVDREHNALIGSIELRVTSDSHQRAEVGYVLHRHSWGKGYASEAATTLLHFGFDELGLHKISATCDPDNAASTRVLTKIGMQLEGHLRDHLHFRGRWRDRLVYAALSDWPPSPRRALKAAGQRTTDGKQEREPTPAQARPPRAPVRSTRSGRTRLGSEPVG